MTTKAKLTNETKEILEKLKFLCWEANVSLTKLCRLAEVNQYTPQRWKKGVCEPTEKILNKLYEKAEELKKKNKFLEK